MARRSKRATRHAAAPPGGAEDRRALALDPAQGVLVHAKTELLGEKTRDFGRLVEAAVQAPHPVKRYRDDAGVVRERKIAGGCGGHRP